MMMLLLVIVLLSIIGFVYSDDHNYNEYKCSLCINAISYIQQKMPIVIDDAVDLANACILSYNNVQLANTACEVLRGNKVAYRLAPANGRDACISMHLCPLPDALPETIDYKATAASNLDFKVTKALGSKGYNKLRISVVSNSSVSSSLFTYQQQFKYKWTDNFLNTGIVDANNGANTFTIAGQQITVTLPAQGEGARGVILSDPCFQSNYISCKYKDSWSMFQHLSGMLNAINAHSDVSFYQILGDNFYGTIKLL